MATYEEIYGKRVKEFDSDPTLESSYEGQVWYDKSSGVLKSVVSFGTWSSANDAIYPSYNTTGFGAQTGSVFVGGSYPGYVNLTQEYNGSGFSTGGNYPESRGSIGTAGVLTAGLAWGGNSAPEVESQLTNEYNGTSWTNVNNYPITVAAPAGAGTQTAGLGAGGWDYSGPFTAKNTTNEYDGTNWTGGGNLNTARSSLFGGGTQTASIMAGGDKFTPGTASDNSGACEEYNGTSWTSVNSLPGTSSGIGGRTTNAVQTDFRIFSSSHGTAFTSPYVKNYEYDGTNWAAGPNFTTARYGAAGSGTGPAAVMTGGRTPSYVLTTEEFNKSINTITAAAWSSGGNLNSARFKMEMNGTQTATIAMGGGTMPSPPSSTTNSEYYDGSSWTNQTAMNNSRQRGGAGAFGTQTAAMSVAGVRNPPSPGNSVTDTEEWGGSSWTSGGAVPSGRYSACFFGIQTAAVFAGGTPGPTNTGSTDSAEYDGSSFSSGNSMSNARYNGTSGGTLTAGLAVMGTASGSDTANCEEYDGTNYSAGGTSLIADQDLGGSGTQTDFSCFIGPTGQTLQYDGTTWRTSATSATALGNTAGTGATANTAIAASGNPGTGTTVEFTGETETVTFKTLTTS